MTTFPPLNGGNAARASGASPARGPAVEPLRSADPQAVRAMREALAKARLRPPAGTQGQPAPTARKAEIPRPESRIIRFQSEPQPQPQLDLLQEPARQRMAAKEDAAQPISVTAHTPPAPAVAQITVPQAPAPQTDPTAFATLIGQIWAREQAKGKGEVQVKLGQRAWPATGVRLVRATDGSLNIALLAGKPDPGLRHGLDELRRQLLKRGVAVGALALEDGLALPAA